MTKAEIIELLKSHGITELRRGESVADALAFVNGVIPKRKGEERK